MNLINNVLNFFYPNVCGICNKINDTPICYNCMNRISKDIIDNRKVYIETKDRYFDEHMYLFRYTDKIRELMIQYKFNEKSYLYKTFSHIILNDTKVINYIKKYDSVICVPIHKKRNKYRGYNQSELIIKDVCRLNRSILFEDNILIKIKNVKPQSSLNKQDRIYNIKNVYKINYIKQENVKNKKILIFDDIFTTGSTVNECARILKKYGAKEIGILTIARD